jgi:hypothetical protein
MKSGIPIEELLRWRLEEAEAEAPPPPSAARLLDLSRPWWEALPERFAELVERLGRVQVAFGHAMAEPRGAGGGHAVPALLVVPEEEIETSARVLYLDVRDGRLRLRFQLDPVTDPPGKAYDVTFVPDAPGASPFSALAVLSVDREYRLESPLDDVVLRAWETLRVTDRIPYRLILQPCETDR